MNQPLIVIPARGGSTGIPRKCTRRLGDKPLLWWTIDTVQGLGRVVVATDDDEIARLAERRGVEVVRDQHPASNTRTLDIVVWDVARQLTGHPVIVTVQPTSPFLSRKMIDDCIFVAEGGSSAITVTATGQVEFENPFEPVLRTPWSTRQTGERWKLTGGCIACPTRRISPSRRWAEPVVLMPVDGPEALDLDEPADWAAAEFYLSRLKVAYRVDGGRELGLGHVYRASTLLSHALNVEARLVMDEENYPDGVKLAERLGLTVAPIDDPKTQEADVLICENRPNGTVEDIREWQTHDGLFVAIEDRSIIGQSADLCFNDLDGPPQDGPQLFKGPRYAIVRDEFLTVVPKPVNGIEHIVLTFGGTDPSDLTRKTLAALEGLDPLDITVILGPGYPRNRELPMRSKHKIHVAQSPTLISPYFEQADLAITSCGRTIYELIACGVPTVALPQNLHELQHASLSYDCGVWAIPQLGGQMAEGALREMIRQAMNPAWREYAKTRMSQVDVRHGASLFWKLVREQLPADVRAAA